MGRKDPRVTAYIARAAPFARPILRHLRAALHEACPTVEETVKWGMPAFTNRGLLGGMAAFKAHCALWLWRGKQLARLGADKEGAMGQFGRLAARSDLPPKAVLLGILREAVRLDEARAAAPSARKAGRPRRGARAPAGPARRGGRAPPP
jgi:hypothetical protein